MNDARSAADIGTNATAGSAPARRGRSSSQRKKRNQLRQIGGRITGIGPGTIRTRRQLLDAGMSRLELDRALANGSLSRVSRGTYRFETSGLRLRMGLVLASTPDAVFSHRTAAHLHGLRKREPEVLDVIVPPTRRDAAGSNARRRESVQVTTIDGMPVTTLAATLADLLEVWHERAVSGVLDRMMPTLASRSSLLADIDDLPPRQRNRLWPVVEWAPERQRSISEGRIARALQLKGHVVELNVRIGPYEWDLVHADARLVIEFDSTKFHTDPMAFREDRARQNNLVRRGYAILRYTDDDLWLRFDEVIDEIVATIGERMGGPRVTGEWDRRRCRELYFERWNRLDPWEQERGKGREIWV
ncbi:DUF559 domain-containing protein [uncultured Corynebacterium sp.]|uniref:DUF559 domain-containing protein n=1 Tax=uncultured Corynebacterium sp. TaxID=159447 RepID=UPI0025D3E451|nr:DUF559 domain-containing protein [uncultured Corynebacterium sp.]